MQINETIRCGRYHYRATPRSRLLIEQAENARRILSEPGCIFPNGRFSHDAAGDLLEQVEDELVGYLTVPCAA